MVWIFVPHSGNGIIDALPDGVRKFARIVPPTPNLPGELHPLRRPIYRRPQY